MVLLSRCLLLRGVGVAGGRSRSGGSGSSGGADGCTRFVGGYGTAINQSRLLDQADLDDAMQLVARIYPHLASLKEFQPDVPLTIGPSDAYDDEDEFDEEAAFEPLADTLAEIVADTDPRVEKCKKKPPKMSVNDYQLKPFSVPEYGRSFCSQ